MKVPKLAFILVAILQLSTVVAAQPPPPADSLKTVTAEETDKTEPAEMEEEINVLLINPNRSTNLKLDLQPINYELLQYYCQNKDIAITPQLLEGKKTTVRKPLVVKNFENPLKIKNANVQPQNPIVYVPINHQSMMQNKEPLEGFDAQDTTEGYSPTENRLDPKLEARIKKFVRVGSGGQHEILVLNPDPKSEVPEKLLSQRLSKAKWVKIPTGYSKYRVYRVDDPLLAPNGNYKERINPELVPAQTK